MHFTQEYSNFCRLLFSIAVKGQDYLNPSLPVNTRIADLLPRLSLEQKLQYIGGYNSFFIEGIDSLSIPMVKMSDGPLGVRTWGTTTAYPAGILNASTWNRSLVHSLGLSFGNDARARGVNIILAPGMNIYRAPMCGRNFEYYGEDPYLTSQTAVQFITGIQSKDVMATAKHFACNNQEYNRYSVSSNVDERTLQEIYLPSFKACVKEAHVGAIMAAYNLVNGVYCAQNTHLINDILKNEWEFDGFIMSDWGATHDGLAAAEAGLDLEMPSGANMNATNLLPDLDNSTLSESVIDDKVTRILRRLFQFGIFDNPSTDTSIPLNNPSSDTMALAMAREGIVLLKNQDSILPLNPVKIKSIAVLGPNADAFVTGGGSSYPSPFSYTSIYKGIVNTENGITVSLNTDTTNQEDVIDNSLYYTDPACSITGLTGNYYTNMNLSGTPFFTRVDQTINFNWPTGNTSIYDFPSTQFSIQWNGYIKPTQTGNYIFSVTGDDGYRLYIGGNLLINDWQDQAATTNNGSIYLTANTVYPINLQYYQDGGAAVISMGYQSIQAKFASDAQAASQAQVAIVCVGFNSNTEGEGFDRTFQLPDNQDSLINAVARANPNTVVILNAGGNVSMVNWINNVKGLLHAWYPGQEGGHAIADILFGNINPSGKLPASFEKQWSDNPVYNSYYDNGTGEVTYSEQLMVGYRGYDFNNVSPMFPFGFGLSYTTFSYSNLQLKADSTGKSPNVSVSFDIQNVGSVYGGEVAQVYVSQPNAPVIRPLKELKGYTKVFLQPGEKQTVTVSLDSSSFAYFKLNQNGFGMDYAKFIIQVGASSRDIRLKDSLTFTDPGNMIPEIMNLTPPNNSLLVISLELEKFSVNFNRAFT